MPDYKSFARGIHVSRHQLVDWDIVAPHIDFAFCKSSDGAYWKDPTFVANVQALYDRGIPCFAFHYFDADYYPSLGFNFNEKDWVPPEKDLQLQNMIEALTHKAIYLNAIDIEETTNEKSDPVWTSEGGKIFTGRASDWLWKAKQKYTLVYSRQSYINDCARNMNNWVHNFDQWVSQPWQRAKEPVETITWEQMESRIPPDSVQVHPMGAGKDWKFWQWSIDRYILPGIYTSDGRMKPRTVCLEMFNGTVADLHQYCGFVPYQPPPPKPVPTGIRGEGMSNYLIVRATPNGKDTGKRIMKGQAFIITETADAGLYEWGKTDGGWVALHLLAGRNVKLKSSQP